jgi:hypothetical protein
MRKMGSRSIEIPLQKNEERERCDLKNGLHDIREIGE